MRLKPEEEQTAEDAEIRRERIHRQFFSAFLCALCGSITIETLGEL
jgi:hypothetical protein